MLVRVRAARSLGDHRVWIEFTDGRSGEVDLSDELEGEIFAPLREPSYFALFRVESTLTWSNGADFAPEFLYDLAVAPVPARLVAEGQPSR